MATVTTPRSRHAARLRARRRRAQQRARWVALAVVLGTVAVGTLALTAFGDSGTSSAPRVASVSPPPVNSAPPETQVLATVGNLRLQSPIAQGGLTAIGFHDSEDALVLQPVGPQANEGLLARLWHRITGSSRRGRQWYQLESGSLRTLDAGAVAGTDVYSPVDGTVVGIRDQVVSGRVVGAEIELRPTAAPSLVVTLANVRPDRALTVGANVASGSSKLGRVADVARYQRQALARYGADRGNNVSIRVYPSASLDVR